MYERRPSCVFLVPVAIALWLSLAAFSQDVGFPVSAVDLVQADVSQLKNLPFAVESYGDGFLAAAYRGPISTRTPDRDLGALQLVRLDGDGQVMDEVPYFFHFERPWLTYHDNGLTRGGLAIASQEDVLLVTYTAPNQNNLVWSVIEPLTGATSTLRQVSGTFPAGLEAARAGDTYLVTWTDFMSFDVLGLRLDADGNPLSATPFAVCDLDGSVQGESCMAANTTDPSFVVVWADFRDNAEDGTLYATRIEDTGEIAHPDGASLGIQVNTPATSITDEHSTAEAVFPALAYGGGQYLLVWGATEKKGVFLNADGSVEGDPFAITTITGDARPQHNQLGYANGVFLLVWELESPGGSPHSLVGVRISSTGEVLDPSPITISDAVGHDLDTKTQSPLIVSDGSRFLCAWLTQEMLTDPIERLIVNCNAATVSTDGVVQEFNGHPVFLSQPAVQQLPTVVWSGSGYAVAWTGNRMDGSDAYAGAILARLFSPLGTASGEEDIVVALDGRASPQDTRQYMSGCWAGDRFVFVWNTNGQDETVRAAALSPDGTVAVPAFELLGVTKPERLTSCPVACNGENLLVASAMATTANEVNIVATLFAPDGTVLKAQFLVESLGGVNLSSPGVAAVGNQFLVTFRKPKDFDLPLDDSGVYGVRISNAGDVLDPAPIPLWIVEQVETDTGPQPTTPNGEYLTTTAAEYLAALRGDDGQVRLIRVATDGTVNTGAVIDGLNTDGFWAAPVVEAEGVSLFWTYFDWSQETVTVTRRMFDADLVPTGAEDETPLAYTRSCSSGTFVSRPDFAVARGRASDFFLAWKDDRIETGQYVYGVLLQEFSPYDINRDGAVNAIDVQLAINAALGLPIDDAYEPDVNGDGARNAIDVQLVINAALGLL